MTSAFFVLVALIVGYGIGWSNGWSNAHYTVATECEKLGSFYVGSRVFKCLNIDDSSLKVEK